MIEINENTSYVRVPTRALFEKDMSLTAKAIYTILCWCPENWVYSISGFEGMLKEGRAAISSALQDLEKHGYLSRKRVRDERGGLGKIDYIVYADPIMVEREQGDRKLDKDTDNIISKETNIKENYINGINPDLLTADLGTFEKFLRRPLNPSEIPIWKKWKESGINPKIIERAIEDNEYRKSKMTLHHVDRTLQDWKESGLSSMKDIENYILDSTCRNTVTMFASKDSGDGLDPELAMYSTHAGELKGWRDDILEVYKTDGERFLRMISECPMEVFKYLPDNMLKIAVHYFDRIGDGERRAAAIKAIDEEASV